MNCLPLLSTITVVAVLHIYVTNSSKTQCKDWISDLADNLPGQQMDPGDSSGKATFVCGGDQSCHSKFAAVMGKKKKKKKKVKFCLLFNKIIYQVIPVVFAKSSLSLTCRIVMEVVNSHVNSLTQHCFLCRILREASVLHL